MKSFFGGSAVIAAALISSSLIISAKPSIAETLLASFQQPKQAAEASKQTSRETPVPTPSPATSEVTTPSTSVSAVVMEATDPAGTLTMGADASPTPLTAPITYVATAYSLPGRTASGKHVSKGLIAADPAVLPLGTRVRLDAGAYSGEYEVADTGTAVKGKKIDIWTPTFREACRFGRRVVKLTVLSYGPRRIIPRKHHKR